MLSILTRLIGKNDDICGVALLLITSSFYLLFCKIPQIYYLIVGNRRMIKINTPRIKTLNINPRPAT